MIKLDISLYDFYILRIDNMNFIIFIVHLYIEFFLLTQTTFLDPTMLRRSLYLLLEFSDMFIPLQFKNYFKIHLNRFFNSIPWLVIS